jgi:hypothetical protein
MRIITYVWPAAPNVEYDELYKVNIEQLDFLCSHFAGMFYNQPTCKSFLILYPDYFTINTIGNCFCDFHFVGPIYNEEDYRFWIKSFKCQYPLTVDTIIAMVNSDKYLREEPL